MPKISVRTSVRILILWYYIREDIRCMEMTWSEAIDLAPERERDGRTASPDVQQCTGWTKY